MDEIVPGECGPRYLEAYRRWLARGFALAWFVLPTAVGLVFSVLSWFWESPDFISLMTAPLLFGLLTRMLRRRAVAEEALQDVFVSIWQRAGQYRSERGNALAAGDRTQLVRCVGKAACLAHCLAFPCCACLA